MMLPSMTKYTDIPEEHDLLKKGHKVYVLDHPELVGRITEITHSCATVQLEAGRKVSLFKSGLRRVSK